jgi:hypothetical protein
MKNYFKIDHRFGCNYETCRRKHKRKDGWLSITMSFFKLYQSIEKIIFKLDFTKAFAILDSDKRMKRWKDEGKSCPGWLYLYNSCLIKDLYSV